MPMKHALEPLRGSFRGESSLSPQEVFSVLSNCRRRFVLHHILQNGEKTTIRELAEQVAAWESSTDTEYIDSEARKRVYTALQQNHLPSMDEAGIINFQKDRGVIERTDAADELDIYLEVAQGRQIPWSEYYLALSVGSFLLVGTAWAVGFPFTLIPPLGYTVFIITVFALSSLGHFYENRTQKFGTSGEPPELGN